jgi:hypothetical protein
MKALTSFATPGFLLALAACTTASSITYDEAVAINARRTDKGEVQGWTSKVFEPFWKAHLEQVLGSCFELVSKSEPSIVRLVVLLSARSVSVPFKEGTPAPLSRCMSSSVAELRWPIPPVETLYVPIEINFRPPDPAAVAAEAEAEAEAEAIMDAMSRSNKSLERTREE